MARSAEDSITVRRLPLSFPAGLDPVIVEGAPEESFFNVGLSLLLPYLEPYLIRTMREAKKHVSDPALLADIDLFNAQEGQHYRQHIRFNQAIRGSVPEGLKELEAELDDDYRRYTETRSLRFNLAYAEGFEALTAAMARFTFEAKVLDRMQGDARELFQWHLVEELEHRTVAFDVYDHVCRAYFYRLFVGLFAQWHLNRFVIRASRVMTLADPDGFRKRFGGARRALARVAPLLWLAFRLLLPKVLATYLPWYTPHTIPLPPGVRALGDRYSEIASRAGQSPAQPDARSGG